MNAPEGRAAPESGTSDGTPAFEELAADPEIAALLDFEPVPRRQKKDGGWTPGMQRLFIARLAFHGSPGRACREIGKFRSGVDKLCESNRSASFRAAWERAVALAERRRIEHVAAGRASTVGPTMPFVDNRRKPRLAVLPLAEGQVLNERGEPEDEASLARRADEARDSISGKLRQARRLYLQEISVCPGKRAAFEILTELPIDWGKAQRLEPQADEPWRRPNLRQGDMLLTAENGWLGDFAHGPDKIAELRRAIDRYREEQGMERVQWDEDPLPSAGEGRVRGQ